MKHKMNVITKALICVFLAVASPGFGQKADPDKIINLHNLSGQYRWANGEPEAHHLQELKNESTKEFKFLSNLVADAFENPDSLLTEKYFILPDSSNLRLAYILNALYFNYSLLETQQKKLIDSLQVAAIRQPDLVHSYYDLLFALAGKRTTSVDLSKVDIDLNRCVPDDTIGQSILFLKFMSKPLVNLKPEPDSQHLSLSEGIEAAFKRYPTFNQKPFFEMTGFPIPDFQVQFYQGIGLSGFYKQTLTSYFYLLYGYYYAVEKDFGTPEATERVWFKTALHRSELYPFLTPQLQEPMNQMNLKINATLNGK